MTTPDKHSVNDTSRLERMLDGIQKKTIEIGSIIRAIYDCVTEIAETTDSIYDLVTYHRDSPAYSPGNDDFLENHED